MKKGIVWCLALLIILALTGCGMAVSSQDGETSAVAAEKQAASGGEPQTAGKKASGQKTLVVYYSASGHTQQVAETIAKETGADIMRLEPTPEYTEADLDYNDPESRVSKEYHEESLRDGKLKQAVPAHWEEYDTVFIGYPIWWGIAAWPVNTFVKSNDFSGKTVIPFCTSASSPLGDSGRNLEQMAHSGNWQQGQRFAGDALPQEVRDWLKSAVAE